MTDNKTESLAMNGKLSLTAQQITALTALRDGAKRSHDAMGQAYLAMLITNARAKALLTDAQRTQLSQMHRGMMEGRRGI